MNIHILSATLKDNAKEKLTGSYGLLIGCHLTVSCISLMVSFLLSGFLISPADTVFSLLLTNGLSLLAATFIGVFQAGIALIYLKLASGNGAVSFSDIFYGYRQHLQTALGISFISALISLFPSLVSDIFYQLHATNGVKEYWWIALFSQPLLQLVCLIISLFLFPCYYLMLDFPGKSTTEILKLSVQVMKGHKGRLLFITLSFLPLKLLGTISLIGGLWVTPYVNMTYALLFFEIMKNENTSRME